MTAASSSATSSVEHPRLINISSGFVEKVAESGSFGRVVPGPLTWGSIGGHSTLGTNLKLRISFYRPIGSPTDLRSSRTWVLCWLRSCYRPFDVYHVEPPFSSESLAISHSMVLNAESRMRIPSSTMISFRGSIARVAVRPVGIICCGAFMRPWSVVAGVPPCRGLETARSIPCGLLFSSCSEEHTRVFPFEGLDKVFWISITCSPLFR